MSAGRARLRNPARVPRSDVFSPPAPHAIRAAKRPECAESGIAFRLKALAKPLICRISSVVEQRFCKPLVGSSNLSSGTTPRIVVYDDAVLHSPITRFSRAKTLLPPRRHQWWRYVCVAAGRMGRGPGLRRGPIAYFFFLALAFFFFAFFAFFAINASVASAGESDSTLHLKAYLLGLPRNPQVATPPALASKTSLTVLPCGRRGNLRR